MNYKIEATNEQKQLTQELGLQIAKIRHDLGISRETLASKSKMHLQLIYDIESGRKNASIYMIARIARGLDLPLSDILKDIDLKTNWM